MAASTANAMANGDWASQRETKKIRDKAFSYLKESVDLVREAGKYLFWKNENRRKDTSACTWVRKTKIKTGR